MGEFVNFITKGVEIIEKDDKRIFSGHISAEVVDHQNDFIFVKEILDIMDVFMKNLPVVSEVHSNRMVGKVFKYEKSSIDGHDSVKVYMEIFKDDRVSLYDEVWTKIKTGVYSGLSMGGGSKVREPMFKDGRMVMSLKNLELYEIAVCPSPANPLALIDKFNEFAKSDILKNKAHDFDGRSIIQCSGISCEFSKKAEGIDIEADIDIDNIQPGIKTSEEAKEIEKEGVSSSSAGTSNPVNSNIKEEEIGKSDGTGMSANDAGATNPIHSDIKEKDIEKNTNGINEIAEETRRKDETIDTKLKDEVDENLKTNNMNKTSNYNLVLNVDSNELKNTIKSEIRKIIPALIAPIVAGKVGEMVADKVLPDEDKDIVKQEVPQKKVDEKGDDLEQFDKPEVKKTHIPGMPEEQEYKDKDKKQANLKKSYNTIVMSHLKRLDIVIEKNDEEIKNLKINKNSLI